MPQPQQAPPLATGKPAPGASPAPPSPSAPSAPTATEIIHRPDPGLGRGIWEAPAWLFYALLGGVVVAGAAYAAVRLGWLRRPKTPS